MLAVSRTVSPCAIWTLPFVEVLDVEPEQVAGGSEAKSACGSSCRGSWKSAIPESQIRGEMFASRMARIASAARNVASTSSRDFSQVSRKSFRYMSIFFSVRRSISFEICFLSIALSLSCMMRVGRAAGGGPDTIRSPATWAGTSRFRAHRPRRTGRSPPRR